MCSADAPTYGAAMSVVTLVQGLRDAGWEVTCICKPGSEFADHLLQQGFDVREVPLKGKLKPSSVRQMKQIFRELKPTVVHTHLSDSTWLGSIAARRSRIPCVATVHGMNRPWTYSLARRLIAVSESARENLVRGGVSPQRVAVVYNAIRPLTADEFMIREHARQRLGISPQEFVLGTLARLVPLKGIDTAIKASAFALDRNRGWKLLIFGDGKQARELRKLAKELKVSDRVEFLGFRSDARGLLPALDVMLFPSRKEAMGMAPAEAMAAGVPVIGSTVGGIPEVVGNTGLLYGPEDVFGFVNGITELYNHPEKRAQLGSAAQCRVRENFSVNAMVEGVLKVYASAASGKPLDE